MEMEAMKVALLHYRVDTDSTLVVITLAWVILVIFGQLQMKMMRKPGSASWVLNIPVFCD